MSRGGGYECDEYILATIHCMTLYMYSLLIPIRAFPSDGRVQRGDVTIAVFIRVIMHTVQLVSSGTYIYAYII
jgi:hypothetical protein